MRIILTPTADTSEIIGELHLGERRSSAEVPRKSPLRRAFSLRSEVSRSFYISGMKGIGERDE
jgi:hypothetical protein